MDNKNIEVIKSNKTYSQKEAEKLDFKLSIAVGLLNKIGILSDNDQVRIGIDKANNIWKEIDNTSEEYDFVTSMDKEFFGIWDELNDEEYYSSDEYQSELEQNAKDYEKQQHLDNNEHWDEGANEWVSNDNY